jgi:hypothetical protein
MSWMNFVIVLFLQTYGFQLENVSTALRTTEREFGKVDGRRNFVLDPESLQLYSEATFQEMPHDISLHTGKYKHRSVLIKCLSKGMWRQGVKNFTLQDRKRFGIWQ